MHLIEFTKAGLYCRRADVYIDPWIPVKSALITHAHSDHARSGNDHYLAVEDSVPILKSRLGIDISCDSVKYGEVISINGVKISFHPAGHVIGSAQIRLEYKGEIWVISGDYKTINDGITTPFESVRCTHFVTESTFGLPSYNWKPQDQIFEEINSWWKKNRDEGKFSIIAAYSLGKAQRVLKNINLDISNVYVHPTIAKLNDVIRNMNYDLPETEVMDYESGYNFSPGSLLLAPPGALSGNWIKKLKSYEEGIVSGWMNTRGNRRRRSVERGFVLSDHADWSGLNAAVEASGAENIYVTHGYSDIFSRWLKEKGYNAHVVSTAYMGEGSEDEITYS